VLGVEGVSAARGPLPAQVARPAAASGRSDDPVFGDDDDDLFNAIEDSVLTSAAASGGYRAG
jgi:hypothetical protein